MNDFNEKYEGFSSLMIAFSEFDFGFNGIRDQIREINDYSLKHIMDTFSYDCNALKVFEAVETISKRLEPITRMQNLLIKDIVSIPTINTSIFTIHEALISNIPTVSSFSQKLALNDVYESISTSLQPMIRQMNIFRDLFRNIAGSFSIDDYDATLTSWEDTESSELCVDPDFYVATQNNAPPISYNDYQTEKSEFYKVAFYGLAALVSVLFLGVCFTNANNIGNSLTTFKSSGPAANYVIEFLDAGIKNAVNFFAFGIYIYSKKKKK